MQQSTTVHETGGEALPLGVVSALLDTLGTPVFVASRSGRILVANEPARRCIGDTPGEGAVALNLFNDLLRVDPKVIADQMENGELELNLLMERPTGRMRARVRPLSGTDWLVVEMQPAAEVRGESSVAGGTPPGGAPPTVQALLQERDITYRNLLAAYLRLQEVNRQKTVFLASAAHELKTPLAVVKGYYDLLLSNSLGKLNDKQRDILQESKDSCERLVRLVSMFLNYSTLESGKLVLHLRDNDLRDCLAELATRWSEAFQRKHVRLDVSLDAGLPIFKFDYQKVQQTVANLLDNALKHTPGGRQRNVARGTAFLGAPQRAGHAEARAATRSQCRRERGSRGGDRYGSGYRLGASSGDFRGFRPRGSHLFGDGPGPGHCQASGASAPREDLGG